MKKLSEIKAEDLTIKARVLADADGEVDYIREVAEHGCSGGSCSGLIYYSDTHAFYNEYASEIDDILQDIKDQTGESILATAETHGDLRNYLAWLAYEYTAQEIMRELDPENY